MGDDKGRAGRAMHMVEVAVQELKASGIPDGGAALDLAGRMYSMAFALTNLADMIVAESEVDAGEHYEITASAGTTTRTYNWQAIVAAVAKRHDSMAQAIEELVRKGVIRLDKADAWSWTGLTKFAKTNDIPLDVRKGSAVEQGSTDGPHVGEVWKPGKRKLVARKDD